MSSDLVVVTYKKDLDLCELFVRSVDRFVDEHLFDNFWIIITDDSEFNVHSRFKWNTIILKDLCLTNSNNGYIDQQMAKIQISKFIDSDWYWVFDSKNFFIRSVTNSDLYNQNKAMVYTTKPSDYWHQSWLNSLALFDLDYVDPIHNRTPYPINTALARNLNIDNFESLWTSKHVCEFFFYNAWVLKQQAFEVYSPDSRIFNTTMWPIDLSTEIYQPQNLRFLLDKHTVSNMPVWSTGLHRTTVQYMNPLQQQAWAEFLIYLKLFDTVSQVFDWYHRVRLAAQ